MAAVIDPEVAAFYGRGFEEDRLHPTGEARLEYVRTLELHERLLPPPPARVLDVGGGTGVYAAPLCERGYTVHLVDPIALHVDRANESARERSLARFSAAVGDARDLDAQGTGYDAVLLLGPLYHLTDQSDRHRALAQAVGVSKPGAIVVAAGISRFASLIDGLKRGWLQDATFRSIVEADLRDGQHRNAALDGRPEFFTTAYFHMPSELEAEARAAGMNDVRLYAVEGPAWIVEQPDDLDNQVFAARATETEPSLLAASAHLLVTGTTPAAPPKP